MPSSFSKGWRTSGGTISAPSGRGTSGQFLYTDGAGATSWTPNLFYSANTIQQRNSVSAQTWEIFRTHTDDLNNAGARCSWSSNDFQISTFKTGTEEAGNIILTPPFALGFVAVGTTTPNVDLVGNAEYGSSSIKGFQLDGQQPRLIVRGSTDASIDFIDTGSAVNEKFLQFYNNAGLVTIRSLTDAMAVHKNIMAWGLGTGNTLVGTTTDDGVNRMQVSGSVKSSQWMAIGVYTDATRPAAGTAGRMIFNSTDGNLNIDTGTGWILPDGTAT